MTANDLGGSHYLEVEHGVFAGRPPEVDLLQERAVLEFILAAAAAGLLRSAHDVAEGGMLVALAECCLMSKKGMRGPPLSAGGDLRFDALLFGETQGRFLVSLPSRSMPEIQNLARKHRIEIQMLGMTGGDQLEFEGQFKVSLEEMERAHEGGLG